MAKSGNKMAKSGKEWLTVVKSEEKWGKWGKVVKSGEKW